MTTALQQQAEQLAAQPYTVEIAHDETTAGEPILVVSHPELPGCLAQGTTLDEALDELEEATREYILSLLEDNLPVPGPLDFRVGTAVTTSGTQGTNWRIVESVTGFQPVSSHGDSEPEQQEKPVTISVVRK